MNGLKELIDNKKEKIDYLDSGNPWGIIKFLFGMFFGGILTRLYFNNYNKLLLEDPSTFFVLKLMFYAFTLILPIVLIIAEIIINKIVKNKKEELKILKNFAKRGNVAK